MSAEGYITDTIRDVSVLDYQRTDLTVLLDTIGTGTGTGDGGGGGGDSDTLSLAAAKSNGILQLSKLVLKVCGAKSVILRIPWLFKKSTTIYKCTLTKKF